MKTLRKFLEPATLLPYITWRAILFSILRTCYNLMTIILIQQVITFMQAGEVSMIKQPLIIYTLALIGTFVFFQFSYHRRRGAQIYAYDDYIQQKYLKIIMMMDNNQFEKIGTGKFISIIKTGSESRSDSLTSLSFNTPASIISLAYSLYLSYQLSPYFLAAYCVLLTLLCWFVIRINNKGLIFRKEMSNIKVHSSRHIVKMLMSKLEIILAGKLHHELQINHQYNIQLTENNIRLSYFTFLTHEGLRGFINIAKIIVVALILYSNLFIDVPLAKIIGFIVTLGYVDSTLQDFAVSYKHTTKKLNDIEKLRSFEEYQSLGESYQHGMIFTPSKTSIILSNINFGYSDSNPLFVNFSLELQAGRKIALVGASGSGKSTLIKLIAGYIKPHSGKITVDGQDIGNISLESYYQHIGYLTQEPAVFDGTIRDNLMYGIQQKTESGNPQPHLSSEAATGDLEFDATSLELDTVISLSRCERIYQLPHGLDTEIGEKGIRLSGGQRQRLAIAKIMLKKPNIILLDEPTSALDSFAEEEVTHAMNNLFENKTVIVVAHRLQTVKDADEIVVLGKKPQSEGVEIFERGKHNDLIQVQNGFYAKMLELQSGF